MSEQQATDVDDAWKIQKRAQLMSRRFDFSDYDEMRDFLDALEELSKQEEYYPDLTFSRTHVNVAIQARDEELAQPDYDFSKQVDLLASKSEQEKSEQAKQT